MRNLPIQIPGTKAESPREIYCVIEIDILRGESSKLAKELLTNLFLLRKQV